MCARVHGCCVVSGCGIGILTGVKSGAGLYALSLAWATAILPFRSIICLFRSSNRRASFRAFPASLLASPALLLASLAKFLLLGLSFSFSAALTLSLAEFCASSAAVCLFLVFSSTIFCSLPSL